MQRLQIQLFLARAAAAASLVTARAGAMERSVAAAAGEVVDIACDVAVVVVVVEAGA